MRAVVTGGAGFIGSHLIEALVARGDEVVCVERPGAPRRWLEGLDLSYRDSGLDDERALSAAFAGADVVFHLAGLTEARAPRDFYAVNTEGTARVFRAAAAHNGRAPRVVLMSSLAALGPCRNGDRLSPDTVPYPISHYGHSKLLAEAIAHAFADRVPAPVAWAVAVAAEACARLRHAAAILNRERLRELVQERWVCDPSRAMTELGFAPQYPVARGVAETAQWYREARWI